MTQDEISCMTYKQLLNRLMEASEEQLSRKVIVQTPGNGGPFPFNHVVVRDTFVSEESEELKDGLLFLRSY